MSDANLIVTTLIELRFDVMTSLIIYRLLSVRPFLSLFSMPTGAEKVGMTIQIVSSVGMSSPGILTPRLAQTSTTKAGATAG